MDLRGGTTAIYFSVSQSHACTWSLYLCCLPPSRALYPMRMFHICELTRMYSATKSSCKSRRRGKDAGIRWNTVDDVDLLDGFY